MTKFNTYGDLTDHIMLSIRDRVAGSSIGVSGRSVSRYVEVDIENDEGDIIETRRVRISDHDATASCGGDIVCDIDIRDLNIEEIYDDCGEFEHIEISNAWKIDEMIAEGIEELTK